MMDFNVMDDQFSSYLEMNEPSTFPLVPEITPEAVDYGEIDQELLDFTGFLNNVSSSVDEKNEQTEVAEPDVHVSAEEASVDKQIDQKIYRIFPMEALRKPRSEFGKWKKAYKNPAVRSLTPRETKRLSALRRVILARVYAEKARLRKGQEANNMKSRLSKLQQENDTLRNRVVKLENILSELQDQFARQSRGKR